MITCGIPEVVKESALETLRRWETAGGHWQVVSRSPSGLVVAMLRCDGGEEAHRFTSGSPRSTATSAPAAERPISRADERSTTGTSTSRSWRTVHRRLCLQAGRTGVNALRKDHERQRDHSIEVHVTEVLETADVRWRWR